MVYFYFSFDSGGSVINSGATIECMGRESCYNARLLGHDVKCEGKSACAEAHFGDLVGEFGDPHYVELVEVSGYRGAESAYFDGVEFVEATGFESLYMASIFSRGIPEMTVALLGKHAGNLATVTCLGL